MRIKITALFIILIIGIASILPGISITASNLKISDDPKSEPPDSHIIEGVPYISQETSFYCAYASFTMLLNNFENINTTLQEVVYYSGIGYSLTYPSFMKKRMPISGTLSSQFPENVKFLTSLFGISPKSWSPEKDSIPEDKYWQEYWIRVKENISNNIPIITSVDPFKLSSFRNLVDFPNLFWNILGPGGHAIVIVGYNESNSSVCYNDPAMALFDHPEYGTYAWMNLKDFNEANIRSQGTRYLINTYEQVSEPLSKQEAFNRTHKRNIEKLRGNLSAYDKYFINLSKGAEFGINGLKLMQNHFEKGFQNRFKTIIIYKLEGKLGIFYRLLVNFGPIVVKLLGLPPRTTEKFVIDTFRRIAIEKSWMAEFLHNNSELSSICEYEAMLFEHEANYWNTLSSCYSVFMKKGIFLSYPRAVFITNKMKNNMNKIIEIENELINFEAEGWEVF